MDQLHQWLVNNIWGMLTLGAVGSILGTIIFILTKKLLSILFPKITKRIKKTFVSIYLWLIKKTINEQIKLFFKSSPSKLNAYYSSLLARIVIYLFISTWLIYGAAITYQNNSYWLSVGLVSIALIFIGNSFRLYLCLSAAWNFDLEARVGETVNDKVKKTVEEMLPKVIDEFLEKKANKTINPPGR